MTVRCKLCVKKVMGTMSEHYKRWHPVTWANIEQMRAERIK